jgi:hypothetical protein
MTFPAMGPLDATRHALGMAMDRLAGIDPLVYIENVGDRKARNTLC